ncbi:tape measure protein [Pseudomonas tohonis]|uniref:tape measure protein n=2 Tax=Pseudomonas tohonis TaxID=2725477 RepID=UPI001F3CA986|nr:tape measure protein [Pseudomonas tohonis]
MTTEIEFRLTADLDSAVKEVAGFRKEYAELVKAVEKPLRQVNAFRGLEDGLEAMGKATADARARVRELGAELIRTEYPSEQLQNSYRVATAELKKLERQEAVQVNRLRTMQKELKEAGVDTTNLVREQRRLAQELTTNLSAGRADAARNGIRALAAEQKRLQVVQRQNSIDAARADFGVNRAREATTAIQKLEQQFRLLKASGTLTANELAIAQRNYTNQVEEARRELARLNGEQQKGASSRLSGVSLGQYAGLAGAGLAATQTFRAYVQAADSVQNMNAQLRLATSSQEEFNRAQEITREIATTNMVPLEDTVKLYARLNVPLKAMGRSQEDTGRVIDIVAKSLRISGASASEASSTIQQFSQALGSGVLRGEEFNAVSENSQRLLKALADGMKVPVQSLRDMASEGKLTASVIVDALLPQWQKLTDEAQQLPQTVGGQFVVLKDRINLALGGVKTKPLIDQMKELGDTISEPKTAENLNTIGAAFIRLGSWGTIALSNVTEGINGATYSVARLFGQISEVDRAEQEIRRLENAIEGVGVLDLLYTDDELKKKLKEWQDYRAKLIKEMTGSTEEERKLQEQRNADTKAANAEYMEELRKSRTEAEGERAEFVKGLEKNIKAQEKLEKDALTRLGKIRDERASIEKKYADAQTALSGAPEAKNTYGTAQRLKVAASQALQKGDFTAAKKRADEALKVILAIEEAGGNTLGLRGFAKELEKIELAATDLEKAKADKSLEEIGSKISDLQQGLDELKNVQITVTMSDEEANKVLAKMQDLATKAGKIFQFQLNPLVAGTDQQQAMALQGDSKVSFPTEGDTTKKEAEKLGADVSKEMVVEPQLKKPQAFQDGTSFSQFPPTEVTPELNAEAATVVQSQIATLAQQFQQQLTVPVTPVLEKSGKYYVSADGTGYSQFPEGYAAGGWTGPGGKYLPVGVVHADEHVQPKEVVNEPGALSFLETIRRNGFQNTMSSLTARLRRGFAEGGLATAGTRPNIPLISPSSLAGSGNSLADYGSLQINLPDGTSFPAMVQHDTAKEIRRQARMRGKSSTR